MVMQQTSPSKGSRSWGQRWLLAFLNVPAFLLFALAVALPSGYSVGAVLLLVIGLVVVVRWGWKRLACATPLTLWGVTIAVMGAAWLMQLSGPGDVLLQSGKLLDRPTKYLLVLLILPGIARWAPSVRALSWGAAVGAAGAGGTALWQVYHLHVGRAAGYLNEIEFGDLSLLLAVWSLVGALDAKGKWERGLMLVAAALGLTASILSDTRGGWLVLPVLLLIALWHGWRRGVGSARIRWLLAGGGAVVFSAALLFVPPVHQRVSEAVHEYAAWTHGQDASSIGLRLTLWRLALHDGRSHPWLGVGEQGFQAQLVQAAHQGRMPQEAATLGHAHNELLDMLAKRGVIGLLALLLFYATPAVLFWRVLHRSRRGEAARAAAVNGLILVVGFVGFGLTEVLFSHNSGNLMYLLGASLWLAAASGGSASADSRLQSGSGARRRA